MEGGEHHGGRSMPKTVDNKGKWKKKMRKRIDSKTIKSNNRFERGNSEHERTVTGCVTDIIKRFMGQGQWRFRRGGGRPDQHLTL